MQACATLIGYSTLLWSTLTTTVRNVDLLLTISRVSLCYKCLLRSPNLTLLCVQASSPKHYVRTTIRWCVLTVAYLMPSFSPYDSSSEAYLVTTSCC